MAVGWEPKAWGFHSDRDLFEEGNWRSISKGYGVGDTVGCGVDFKNKAAFFTKQGKLLGEFHLSNRRGSFPSLWPQSLHPLNLFLFLNLGGETSRIYSTKNTADVSLSGIKGKLYPTVSLNQTMKGARFSTKFATKNSTWHEFMFDGDFSTKVEDESSDAKRSAESGAGSDQDNGSHQEAPILDEDMNLVEGDDDDDGEYEN